MFERLAPCIYKTLKHLNSIPLSVSYTERSTVQTSDTSGVGQYLRSNEETKRGTNIPEEAGLLLTVAAA